MAYEAEKQRIYDELTAAIGITRAQDFALIREAGERAFEARQQTGMNVCNCPNDQIVHPTAAERRVRLGVPSSVGTAEIALWNYQFLDPVGAAINGWLNSTAHRAVLDSAVYDYWGLDVYTEMPPGVTDELQRRWWWILWFSTDPIDQAGLAVPSEVIVPTKKVKFEHGDYWGYKFGWDGRIISKKKVGIGESGSSAQARGRSLIPNRAGTWLLVANGAFKDHWVKEIGFNVKPNESELS